MPTVAQPSSRRAAVLPSRARADATVAPSSTTSPTAYSGAAKGVKAIPRIAQPASGWSSRRAVSSSAGASVRASTAPTRIRPARARRTRPTDLLIAVMLGPRCGQVGQARYRAWAP